MLIIAFREIEKVAIVNPCLQYGVIEDNSILHTLSFYLRPSSSEDSVLLLEQNCILKEEVSLILSAPENIRYKDTTLPCYKYIRGNKVYF